MNAYGGLYVFFLRHCKNKGWKFGFTRCKTYSISFMNPNHSDHSENPKKRELEGQYHYFTPVHNEVIKSSATLGHLWCSIENCLRIKWLLIKSLFFQIKPSEGKVIFKVFVRYGQRPTVKEHDLSKQIPHPSCLKSSQGSYSHCRNEVYDVLLLPDKLNKPGKYYIGILCENDEGELQTRRKKRSCSEGGRQKRSCV